jgi:hypothetical protein
MATEDSSTGADHGQRPNADSTGWYPSGGVQRPLPPSALGAMPPRGGRFSPEPPAAGAAAGGGRMVMSRRRVSTIAGSALGLGLLLGGVAVEVDEFVPSA